MVEMEKTSTHYRADYALHSSKADVSPVLLIEAKSLGEKLQQIKNIDQATGNGYQLGTKTSILTDGQLWVAYDVKEKQEIGRLDILKDNQVTCASTLVQWLDAAHYWPLADEAEDIRALRMLLQELQMEVAKLKKMPGLAVAELSHPVAQAPLPDPHQIDGFVELSALGSVKGRKPARLRFPNGQEISTTKWSQLLRACREFALHHHPALSIPLTDRPGGSSFLLSFEAPTGNINYEEVTHNGRKIFIRTNYSAQDAVANARYVLGKVTTTFPYAPALQLTD